jgi:hypothetical protein
MGFEPMNESLSVKTYLRAGMPDPVSLIPTQGEGDAAISYGMHYERGVKLP